MKKHQNTHCTCVLYFDTLYTIFLPPPPQRPSALLLPHDTQHTYILDTRQVDDLDTAHGKCSALAIRHTYGRRLRRLCTHSTAATATALTSFPAVLRGTSAPECNYGTRLFLFLCLFLFFLWLFCLCWSPASKDRFFTFCGKCHTSTASPCFADSRHRGEVAELVLPSLADKIDCAGPSKRPQCCSIPLLCIALST